MPVKDVKIEKLVVSRAVKVNLGNYESIDFFTSIEIVEDIHNGTTLKDANVLAEVLIGSAVKRSISTRSEKPVSLKTVAKKFGLGYLREHLDD